MGTRLQLQSILEALIGSRNVYFQPPESLVIKYPCIVYSIKSGDTKFANDVPYTHRLQYNAIVIDRNPDSEICSKMAYLPMCVFDRSYTKDNLNHYVYNIYY